MGIVLYFAEGHVGQSSFAHQGGNFMFHIASEEYYRDNQIIFREGEVGDWVYVIEAGSVELSKMVQGRKVVIAILHPGEILGDLGFFVKTPRTATATAMGTTILGNLDRRFLDEEYNKLSGGFRIIIQSLANRLKNTTQKACRPH
jgi:CRP/FNR family cyclic AMP-dependent transcriptional regulator